MTARAGEERVNPESRLVKGMATIDDERASARLMFSEKSQTVLLVLLSFSLLLAGSAYFRFLHGMFTAQQEIPFEKQFLAFVMILAGLVGLALSIARTRLWRALCS